MPAVPSVVLNNGVSMQAIAGLDTESSSFFDDRDPAMVKTLSEAQRPT